MSKPTGRASYTAKNIPQRIAYQKYIRSTERQPTMDENFDFDSTVQEGEELAEPTSKRKRPVSATKKIGKHFNQHWVEWVIGIFIFVSLYVYVDTGRAIAVLETKLENQKEQTDRIELNSNNDNARQSQKNDEIDTSVKKLEEENNLQDLIINELKIKLLVLEDKINSIAVTSFSQP